MCAQHHYWEHTTLASCKTYCQWVTYGWLSMRQVIWHIDLISDRQGGQPRVCAAPSLCRDGNARAYAVVWECGCGGRGCYSLGLRRGAHVPGCAAYALRGREAWVGWWGVHEALGPRAPLRGVGHGDACGQYTHMWCTLQLTAAPVQQEANPFGKSLPPSSSR